MTRKRPLEGKICLITGAGSGIGRASARAAFAAGASVALLGRKEAALRQTAEGAPDALILAADVTDQAAMKRAVDTIVDRFGRLDAAINNAGWVPPPAPVATAPIDDFVTAMSVNFYGTLYSMRAELDAMSRTGGGAIVNLTSIGGLVGSAGNGAYCASKHAIVGLTRSAAIENAASGIRINAVAPGIVDTPMTAPLLGNPDIHAAIRAALPIGRV
ncbi:MAG: SDR family NAD(P)-dependent oxidoreductase, partial [Caulobacterales bacterium]